MALDYTMTRDAVNAAVQSDLLNANRIGQSAAQLGYLGADAFKELGLGQGGLFNFLKGRQNPFTQESIDTTPNTQFGDYGDVNPMDVPMDERVSFEDPNRVYDQPNMDILSQVPTHEAKQGLINSLTAEEGVSEEIPEVLDEIDAPVQEVSPEPTGAAAGGSIGSVNPDGSYEYIHPDGRIEVFQAGDQPGVDQGVAPQTLPQAPIGPINTALANEQGMGIVSTAPPISASNLQGVDSPGMPGDGQGFLPPEYGMTDEEWQNQQEEDFWNYGTPDDPRFQTIRWPNEDEFVTDSIKNDLINYMDWGWHDSPRGSDEGLTNEQTGSPLMDYLNKVKGLFNKGKAALGLGEEDPYKDFEFDESGGLISDTRYGGKTKEQLESGMFPNWQSNIKAGADGSFFSDEFSSFLPEARDSLRPTNAKQMDSFFGQGFSDLQPDFRLAFRKTAGRKLPNKYSTDPKVLEYLKSKGINPEDVIWE